MCCYFLNFYVTGIIVDNTECDERKRPENSTKCRAEDCPNTATKNMNYLPKNSYNSSQHKWMLGKWTKVKTKVLVVKHKKKNTFFTVFEVLWKRSTQ